jgi:cell division protein FtsI/penicillin-binding protein 2
MIIKIDADFKIIKHHNNHENLRSINKQKLNIKKDISWRVYLSYIGLVIFSICIIARIAYTQQVQGRYWKSLADSLTTDFKTIEADRGNI